MQLKLPVVKVMVDPAGYQQGLQDSNSTFEASAVTPANGSCFEEDFFSSLSELILAVSLHLVEDQSLHALVVCSQSDEQFAVDLCKELIQLGTNAFTARQMGVIDVDTLTDTHIIVPVLSAAFLQWDDSVRVIRSAQRCQKELLPVLRDFAGYTSLMQHPEHMPRVRQVLPYLGSVLNCRNRLPSCSDFEDDKVNNLHKLATALRHMIRSGCRTEEGRLSHRIPKYASLLSGCNLIPSVGDFGDAVGLSDFQVSIQQLRLVLLPRDGCDLNSLPSDNSGGASRVLSVIFICPDESATVLASSIGSCLLGAGPYRVLQGHDDHVTWYSCCNTADVVVPVLNAAFVRGFEVEGQITYAKDCGKRIVPVMQHSKAFWSTMSLGESIPQDLD